LPQLLFSALVAAEASAVKIRRLPGNPIIRLEMLPGSDGNNSRMTTVGPTCSIPWLASQPWGDKVGGKVGV
jgi:hypothetical protein